MKQDSNLGEILRGDRITNSLYNVIVGKDQKCVVLGAGEEVRARGNASTCTREYNLKEVQKLRRFVKDDYRVNCELDNMPAAQPMMSGTDIVYAIGFPMGTASGNKKDVRKLTTSVNNHLAITVKYHAESGNKSRITGFEVEPHSIDYELRHLLKAPDCQYNQGPVLYLSYNTSKSIAWTYSVTWVKDTVEWTDRFDRYFSNADTHIHWFSIINSLMIVLFLSGMIAMIMIRTLHADILKYSAKDAETDAEETGWKLLHADVFRAPKNRIILSVFVGFGSQVFAMTVITLLCGLVGLVSPANKGSVLSGMIALFVLMGAVAGYNTSRIYKMMKGLYWKKAALMTAFLFPTIIFAVFMFIDFLILGQKSSGAVPFGTFMIIIALWFGVSIPLVFAGAFYGYKKAAITIPVTRINPIPRTVPSQVWYMHPVISVAMGGILPFGAIFIELYFVLTAIWNQQLYYIATFLFIVFLILFVTCAEISVVMCYFQLCSEDHHWWWRSYFTSASSAFYLFLYSVFYFFTKLEISNAVSGMMYFGYTAIFTLMFFVLTGFIGFYSALMFVRKIYGSVPLS